MAHTDTGVAGGSDPGASGSRSSLAALLPVLSWLRAYEARWLRLDFLAGLTLAAYLLPAALGDAALAGLPPEAGLYACLFSGLVFWAFSSSRHTAITVTSAISLLIGSSLAGLSGGDPARHLALASCTALMVGALALLAWLVRAGAVVNFVSETVLVGWKAGVALFLASTQMPKLFGFKGSHGDFWERSAHFLGHLGETNATALAVGAGAFFLLLLGKLALKNRPVALFVVVAGIAVGAWADLGARGVALLGEVPQGLPRPSLPPVRWADLNELLPLAMACFLLAAVETTAIGRTFGLKHAYRIDASQEFLALAGANVAAGLGGGFPVSGGMSQSLVNEAGGARTQLSGLVAALLVLVVAIFLTGLLSTLPQPVLAAVILMAVAGLVKVEALRRIWSFSRTEFVIAMAAMLGVLGSGLLRGVLIGVILSILLLLRRASRPPVAVLGRVPGSELWGDVSRNPENQGLPGVFVFRQATGILYFNVEYLRDQFLEHLRRQPVPVRLAVWCLGTTPTVDLAGADMLVELRQELEELGILLLLAEARGPTRDALRAAGLERHFGPIEANAPTHAVVQDGLARLESARAHAPSAHPTAAEQQRG